MDILSWPTGSGYGFDGIVNTFADLPVDATTALEKIYLVRTGTGSWFQTRYQPGLYQRVNNTGTRATDWQYLGEWLEEFRDSNFSLYNGTDNSKQLKFDLSGLTTGSTRTLGVPNASGTLALTSDLAGYQPLDSDLTSIAALSTTSFGRALLTQADAAATRATIGAGTSSFSGSFSALSGIPTTLSGYGITDAQPLNTKLTSISALANAVGWLHNDGAGGFAYSIPTKSDVGLGLVENTALSTWAGSANLTTLGYANRVKTIDATSIACWGDSLTADVYPYSLSKLTGLVYFNGGVGGETSTQIKTRMLAATSKFGQRVIIWAGRNNYTDPTTIKADIAAMVAALTTTNYLVLSVLNSDIGGIGTSEYTLITGLNADLASIYGSHYLDVRSYIVSQYNPSIPQDVTDHSNDIPPSSLRIDSIHLTQSGYALVAAYIYANFSPLDSMFTPLAAEGFSAALTDVLGGGFGPPVLFGSTLQVGVPVIAGFNLGVFGKGTSLTKQGLFSNSITQSAYFTVGRVDDEIEFAVAANAGDFFASAPAGAAIFKNFNWVNPIMIGIGGYYPTITITRGGGYGATEPGYTGFGNQSPLNGVDIIGYSGDEARGSVRFTHSTSHDGQISFGNLSGTDVMRLSQFDHASVANRIDLLTLYPTGRLLTSNVDVSPQSTGLTITGGATVPKTLTIQGTCTVDDWFDQNVKQAGSPTFAGLTVTGSPIFGRAFFLSHATNPYFRLSKTGGTARVCDVNGGDSYQVAWASGGSGTMTFDYLGNLILSIGSIFTGPPLGGTAQPWKFGSIVAAASTPDATRYVQAEINGVVCKLALIA